MILEMPVVEQFASPVGHSEVVFSIGPTGRKLPYYYPSLDSSLSVLEERLLLLGWNWKNRSFTY